MIFVLCRCGDGDSEMKGKILEHSYPWVIEHIFELSTYRCQENYLFFKFMPVLGFIFFEVCVFSYTTFLENNNGYIGWSGILKDEMKMTMKINNIEDKII